MKIIQTIYRSDGGKKAVLALYDSQLKKLGCVCKDIYVDTSFGKTHLVETGKDSAPPLLVFHGGNSTTAYQLLRCQFLLDAFHVFAVDIVGHPGKSAETSLSPFGYNYGRWASEVIDRLGFERMRCFGGSFGGGVLAKLLCVSPEKVEKCVLIVPAGIHNAFPISSVKMMVPLLQYRRTKSPTYVKKTARYMAISEDVLDEDTLDTIKSGIDHVKTKVGMPSNVSGKRLAGYTAPIFVMAGERDCLFPSKKVLKRANRLLPQCHVYELKGRGHMHLLTPEEKGRIVNFLK